MTNELTENMNDLDFADLPEVSYPDPIATPVVWVVYKGTETLGVYSDPKYAAQNVHRRLAAQHEHMMQMHHRSKTQQPRAPYMLTDGYEHTQSGEHNVAFEEFPTVEAMEAFILYRTNVAMGSTIFGIGGSTYALSVCPLPVDAD
jgi:hypothetical protein